MLNDKEAPLTDSWEVGLEAAKSLLSHCSGEQEGKEATPRNWYIDAESSKQRVIADQPRGQLPKIIGAKPATDTQECALCA